MSIFAVIEAYALAYGLTPFALLLGGWWLWAIATCALLTISYFFTYLVFNRWDGTLWQKGALSLLVIAISALASSSIPRLFYPM